MSPNIQLIFLVFAALLSLKNAADDETRSTTNICLKTCEDCGTNSIRCISNQSECSIECECKEGYSGESCNLADFKLLKKRAWSNLAADMDSSKNDLSLSLASYESLLKRLGDLVEDLVTQNDLDNNDVNEINRLLGIFLEINRNRPYPNNERSIGRLFKIADRLIIRSIDVHKTLENLDRFTRYFRLENENNNLHVKFDSFEALVMRFSNSLVVKPLLKSSNNDSSISLNEVTLKEMFLSNQTSSLNIVLKSYYNYTQSNGFLFASPNVLSAVIGEYENHDNLAGLVRIEFTTGSTEKQLVCKLLDQNGDWSTKGCHTSHIESGFIPDTDRYRKVCYCNRLSSYSLVFGADNRYTLEILLDILTYIGVSVSCVCYLILILNRLFSCWKKPPPFDKTLIYLYLCLSISLLASNLLFLALFKLKHCLISASIFHFFLLSAFCFSFAASWLHYKKLVMVFQNDEIVLLKWTMFSILFSLVISIFYSHQMSHDLSKCWLQKPIIHYYFVIPVLAISVLSLIFYSFVAIRVLSIYNYLNRNKPDSDQSPSNSYNHRHVIVLLAFSFVSLGLAWLIRLIIALIMDDIDVNLKLILEFLFVLANSSHAISLLIGNFLAKKYSIPGSNSDSSTDEPLENGLDIEMTLSVRFFVCFYGLGYRIRRFLGFRRLPRNAKDNNEESRENFIEFYVVNCDSSRKFLRPADRIEISTGPDWINIKNDDIY